MSNVWKERTVGDVEIYVTNDGRIFVSDLRQQERVELTSEYHNRVVDERLMIEIEFRVRSGDLPRLNSSTRRRPVGNELYSFLKD